MIGWIYLVIAIGANIVANSALKAMAVSMHALSITEFIAVLSHRSVWIAALSCAILVGSYVLALSWLPLSVAYAAVTILALVGINAVAIVFFNESVTTMKLSGIGLCCLGIAAIVFGS